MLKRKKPLNRATPKTLAFHRKPRKPISRKPGKRAKTVKAATDAAKDFYFKHHKHECQLTGEHITRNTCVAHHKVKRSVKIDDSFENLVILEYWAHARIHADGNEQLLKAVAVSSANVRNGEKI